MTAREELTYLIELLLSSQNWTRSENDDIPVVLEIRDRIERLTESPDNGEEDAEDEPDKYERQYKYTEGKVRVAVVGEDGKTRRSWFPKDQCELVPMVEGGSKMRWVLKDKA